ncbi:M56 family metallopeptidase [Mucilaginibacter koreensis]
MTTWWHYLLLANLYLILFYAFYALLLKRETFFQLNRIYLVASAALSFILPLVQSDWVKHWLITERVEQTIYQVNPAQLFQVTAMPDNRITLGDLLSYVYLFGLLFMAVKLCLQLIALRRLLKRPESEAAYSFFNKIQVNEAQPGHDIITAHEETHSRQLHSADRLLLEVLLIVSWFNPVIYLYRRAVKHLHEFIADDEVVSTGTSKKQYAQLLVNQAFMAPPHQLINPFFNKSLLKQRIIMLQKNKSKRVALVKYGLSAPLFAAMLVLSSATLSKSQIITQINFKTDAALDVAAADAAKLVTTATNAPNKDEAPAESMTINVTEGTTPPVPAGGLKSFYNEISSRVHYPAAAREAKVAGKVMVGFMVEKDGSLTDVHAIKGPGYGLNEEAVKAVSASAKWKPGTKDGKPARTALVIPVNFALRPKADVLQLQIDTVPEIKSEVFTAVEQSPMYVGGMDEFYKFLGRTIHYPAKARETGIQGRVIVTFIVEKDGSLSDVKAVRGPGYGLDEEAVRAVSNSSKWAAGRQNGRPVRTQYTVPIQFSLPDAKHPPEESGKPAINKNINEVVVVGYGTSAKANSTGSGNQNGGRVNLSLEGPNQPLYIVDGKEVNRINNLSSDDIQTIEVLKDKTAVAKYGEKAANGAVIVTMKKKQ